MKRANTQNIQQRYSNHNRTIKVLSLDIGETVGIAQTDANQICTLSLRLTLGKAITYVTDAMRAFAHLPTLLVVGHPVTLCGKRSAYTRAVENIAKIIRRRFKAPVVLWDERLTTKWTRSHQHAHAAARILQSFLNAVLLTNFG